MGRAHFGWMFDHWLRINDFFFSFKQRDLNDFWKVWVNSNGWFNVGLNMQHASASYCKASKTSKIVLFINFILYLHNYFAISSINYSSFVRNDIAVERRIYAYWKITVEMRIFLFCLLSEQNVFFFIFRLFVWFSAQHIKFHLHTICFFLFFFLLISNKHNLTNQLLSTSCAQCSGIIYCLAAIVWLTSDVCQSKMYTNPDWP